MGENMKCEKEEKRYREANKEICPLCGSKVKEFPSASDCRHSWEFLNVFKHKKIKYCVRKCTYCGEIQQLQIGV